ncbi:MAG: hypothetical protein WAU65_02110 [Candidatus Nanoarchaeia archaeon]
MKRTAGMYKFGIGFWTGALVYSIINLIMNSTGYLQSKVLVYNYIISGAAIIGFVLNLILLKKIKK